MKVNKENLEDRLQRLLDEREDKQQIEGLFTESKQMDDELKAIRETDSILKEVNLDEPSSGFASRVMMHLDDVKIARAVNKQAWILLIGVFTTLFITGVLLNAVSPDLIKVPDGVNLVGQEVNLERFTGLFRADIIMKGLMFITFLLGMLIFDRAVLKPFFEKRKMA